MKYTSTLIAAACLTAAGCGSSSNNSEFEFEHHQPRVSEFDNEPAQETVPELPTLALTFGSPLQYSLEDFWLGDDVLYWELRTKQGSEPSSPTAWSYDPPSREALSESQKASLESADSEHGLLPCVQLADCIVFGAAVTQDGIQILSTNADLLAFFSSISSEAKLQLWLWANEYQGHTYEVVESGYEAIVQVVDPLCVEDQFYRVFVDTNGVITETETLMTRTPEVCP